MNVVTSLGVAGTERQVVSLALALEPARYAVHFGCMSRWGQLFDMIDARGVPVFDYRVGSFRHPRILRDQLRLARDVRRLGIDIVHTYGFYANLFAIPAAKLAGARVIASIRDMGVYLSANQLRAQRLVCRLADQILVNASAIRDWLVAGGYNADRIMVIPNGIDLARFDKPKQTGWLHQKLAIPSQGPLIGVVGRVARMKGIDHFLRAAAMVACRFPEARFVVVGDAGIFVRKGDEIVENDSYKRELQFLVRELQLEDRVYFAGFQPEVERVFPELTVSVQPSLSEGLSNTLLEAMASAAPVVATRVGGAAEVIRNGENGLLVPPGDPPALAAAIGQLLSAPDAAREMGQDARRTIIERYSMPSVVERTAQVYDSLLSTGRRGRVRTPVSPSDYGVQS